MMTKYHGLENTINVYAWSWDCHNWPQTGNCHCWGKRKLCGRSTPSL